MTQTQIDDDNHSSTNLDWVKWGVGIVIALWLILTGTQLFSSVFLQLPFWQKIEFFALGLGVPILILFAYNLRRRHQTIAAEQKNVTDSLDRLIKQHDALIGDEALAENLVSKSQLLNQTAQTSSQHIDSMITKIDERINSMQTLSQSLQNRFDRIIDSMGKALRDNLDAMSQATQQSMGKVRDVADIIKKREESIASVSSHFNNLHQDLTTLLQDRQQDIYTTLDAQIQQMLDNFSQLKEDMIAQQRMMFDNIITQNHGHFEQIDALVAQHDKNIADVSSSINERQETLLSNFENGNNNMYLRIQKILQQLGTNNDQLINRIESRQVQMRDLLERNNEHFSSLFKQYNDNYQHTGNSILEAVENKTGEYCKLITTKLDDFSAQLSESSAKTHGIGERMAAHIKHNEQNLDAQLQGQNQELYRRIGEYFQNHENWLGQLSTDLDESYQKFHKRSHDYKDLFEQTIDLAGKSTKDLGQNLHRDLEQIVKSVGHADEHMQTLTEKFGKACDKLETVHQQSETILDKVDKSLIANTDMLVQNTDRLQNCSAQLETNLRSQSHKITEITTYVHEEQEKVFDALNLKISERIRQLKEAIQLQTTVISRNLDESIDKQNEAMNLAMSKNLERVENVHTKTKENFGKICSDILGKFAAQGQQLETSVIDLLQRLIQSTQTLDEGIVKVGSAINSTDNRIDSIKNISQNQLNFYENLLTRIEQNSHQMRSQINEDQELLAKAVSNIEHKALNAKDNLLNDSAFFLERTEDIAGRFAAIQEKLSQHLHIIGDVSSQAQNHCMQMDEKLRGQVNVLQSAINAHNSTLSSAFTPAIEQMNNVSQEIQDRAQNFYQQFSQSVTQVNDASANLTQRGKQIMDIFTNAEATITGAQGKLMTSADKMDEVAQKISKQSNMLEHSLHSQLHEVEKSAQEFEGRIHNLTGSLGRYLTSFRESGDDFQLHFTKTGQEFQTIATQIHKLFSGSLEDLQKNGQTFENTLRQFITGVQKTGNIVQAQKQQMTDSDQKMLALADHSGKAVATMIGKFDSLHGAFDRICEKINHNLNRIGESVNDRQNGMMSVNDNLQTIHQQLTQNYQEVLDITRQAAEVFQKIPDDLNQQAQQAIAQAGTQDRDVDSHPVVSSVHDILNQLHETSSYLSHLMMPEEECAPFDAAFQAGEKHAFTHHLLEKLSLGHIDEFSQRINQNNMMRAHVENYQNKFESLVAHAKQADPHNSLAESFNASDVGRLYMVFAQASGRQPINFDSIN